MKILIRAGRLLDPANKLDIVADILIDGARIAQAGPRIKADGATIIDANGKVVMPGLIDMHTHLREPGREDEETFVTGSRAAAKGGFTTVCAMPNTEPVCDTRSAVEYIISEARKKSVVNILPIGAITVGERGEDMAEISDMKKAGIIAISDDGVSVKSSQLMRKALEYARMLDMLVIAHCEDLELTAGGVMNEGYNSTLLGLKGIPNASEAAMVARDIMLAELAGARLHIAHVSTAESIDLIRQAKARGVRITAETCPHYFTLSDDALKSFDTNFKVNPPLRSKDDVSAIKQALKDGTIDVIATDHAPHTEAEKDVEFDYAPCGMIGLQTALALAITELANNRILDLGGIADKMSSAPAKILKLANKGTLRAGADADIIIIDPAAAWALKKQDILSKSKNSPFIDRPLTGRVITTIVNGRVVEGI